MRKRVIRQHPKFRKTSVSNFSEVQFCFFLLVPCALQRRSSQHLRFNEIRCPSWQLAKHNVQKGIDQFKNKSQKQREPKHNQPNSTTNTTKSKELPSGWERWNTTPKPSQLSCVLLPQKDPYSYIVPKAECIHALFFLLGAAWVCSRRNALQSAKQKWTETLSPSCHTWCNCNKQIDKNMQTRPGKPPTGKKAKRTNRGRKERGEWMVEHVNRRIYVQEMMVMRLKMQVKIYLR